MQRQVRTTPRKRPRQERSKATVDTILEATARVLKKQGFDGLSTNAVAAQAGVSIGSLYQYFPNKEALVAKLDAAASKALPGTALGWTQPIEMRENELLGGTRSDVGIKIYGDDFDVLRRLVDETKRSMASIAGATDIRSEPLDGLSQLAIRPDPERMGRLDVRPSDVATLAETMRAGREEGVFVDRERRFDVHMKLDRPPPPDQASIARAPLVVEGGRLVPLGDVATITAADGPGLIGRENARRRVQIECNVRGRDLASFVQELRAKGQTGALGLEYSRLQDLQSATQTSTQGSGS